MAKKKVKISIETPKELHRKIVMKNYDLEISQREYFLCLALIDLGLIGNLTENQKITSELIEEAREFLKGLNAE